MTPIERAARAMCEANRFDPDEIMPNDGPRWRYYAPGVRVLLQAIREPSEGMVDAGAEGSGENSTGAAIGAWQAMIDADLTE